MVERYRRFGGIFCLHYQGSSRIGASTTLKIYSLRSSKSLVTTHQSIRRQVFNNNPQGSRLRGRPKKKQMVEMCTDINKYEIESWKERLRNITDWGKFIKEARCCVGQQCHRRRRRRRRRRRPVHTDLLVYLRTLESKLLLLVL